MTKSTKKYNYFNNSSIYKSHDYCHIHFIVGVCPYFDTFGERLQMGTVSCRTGSENCSARYLSTSVYKCKISIYNI